MIYKFKYTNIAALVVMLVSSFLLVFFERGPIQLVLILVSFMLSGIFVRRAGLFAGIAIMVISVLLTLNSLIEVEKGEGGKFLKKFEFNIETGEEEK
jgi:hypothetical protein